MSLVEFFKMSVDFHDFFLSPCSEFRILKILLTYKSVKANGYVTIIYFGLFPVYKTVLENKLNDCSCYALV